MADVTPDLKQREIEARWRSVLLETPTSENYRRAYDELHDHVRGGGRHKVGTRVVEIQDARLGLVDRLFLNIAGTHDRVLEIGVGYGALVRALARQGNETHGLDISPVALETAQSICGKEVQVNLQLGDANALPYPDGHFGFVFSAHLLEHLHPGDVSRHLTEVRRVLKPGGSYVAYTPNLLFGHTSLGLHLREYSVVELGRIFQRAGFRVSWVDARWFGLGIRVELGSRWLPLVGFYEAILKRLPTGMLPYHLQGALIPPACLRGVNRVVG